MIHFKHREKSREEDDEQAYTVYYGNKEPLDESERGL